MDKEIIETDTFVPGPLLPKRLEESEAGKKVYARLKSHRRAIYPGNDFIVSSYPVSQEIMNALYSARRSGFLIRGFEDAEKALNAERTGIENIDKKTGINRKERISRLVVVANDGSERFYRQTKKLVEKNTPRVLAIYLDVTSFELGERIFGQGKRALFLLISHKDAVTDFLTSLIK
jgi:hypothetical protein